MTRGGLLVAVAVVTACTWGTYDESDASVDAGPVVVTQVRYHVTDVPLTVTPVNVDFSTNSPTAHVFTADGGLLSFPSIGTGSGTFTVDGIPDGATYYVKLSSLGIVPLSNAGGSLLVDSPADIYVFSDARALDLSEYLGGRTNVAVLDAGAVPADTPVGNVQFDLTNVTPPNLALVNVFSVFTVNSGFGDSPGSVFDPVTNTLASDASLSGSTFAGSDPVYSPSPITLPTDNTYVYAMDFVDAGIDPSNPPAALTQAAGPLAVALPGSLDAPLTTAQSTSASVTWNRGAFVQYVGQLSESNQVLYQSLQVGAQPDGDAGAYTGQSGSLYSYQLVGAHAADTMSETIALQYGDPFPAQWGRSISVQLFAVASRHVALGPDGGLVPFNGNAFIECTYDLGAVANTTLEPLITPPMNVEINGHAGFSDQLSTGITQPVLSWAPPAVGTPSSYYVGIRSLVYTETPTPRAVVHFVAFLIITPTLKQVTLPAGLLAPGGTYQFNIIANTSSAPPNSPLLANTPACAANVVTGLYSP